MTMHKRVVRRSDQPKIRHADHERQKNTSLQTQQVISNLRLFTSKGSWTISKIVPANASAWPTFAATPTDSCAPCMIDCDRHDLQARVPNELAIALQLVRKADVHHRASTRMFHHLPSSSDELLSSSSSSVRPSRSICSASRCLSLARVLFRLS